MNGDLDRALTLYDSSTASLHQAGNIVAGVRKSFAQRAQCSGWDARSVGSRVPSSRLHRGARVQPNAHQDRPRLQGPSPGARITARVRGSRRHRQQPALPGAAGREVGGVLSAGSIDRGAVVDAVHDHDTVLVENLIHDPVSATASGVQTVQLPLKQRADTVGIFDQCAEHELYDRRGSALRSPVSKFPCGRSAPTRIIQPRACFQTPSFDQSGRGRQPACGRSLGASKLTDPPIHGFDENTP